MPKAALISLVVLVSVILLVIIVTFIANTLFNQSVTKEVNGLFNSQVENKKEVIQKSDLAGLPLCVQRWLEHAQVIGKEKISTVRLKQKGLMRLKEDGPWIPADAEQYFIVDKPGFVWKVKVRMAPLLYFTGMDKYYEGKGTMKIKVLSVIPIVNAAGPEMNQGSLLRYLAETMWFPTAALNYYIKWQEIDAHSARATMSYGGVTASGVFTFNEKGEVVTFIAQRYRELDGKYVLQDWGGITKGYGEFNGIRIPNKTDIIWRTETGDFNWFKCEITDIEFNKPVIY